ncbi:MAG TPA: alpha/beta fold hydrolase [Edaphobacter sp.]|nr:alpha/beta fold hydrolase [Edaphobacter sp.]
MKKHWWKLLLVLVVVAVLGFLGYDLIASQGTFVPSRPVSKAGGSAVVAGAEGHRIAGRVYVTGAAGSAGAMVVVLHGDAPYNKPRYQYGFASEVADAVPGTRVVALLRPGYADPYGAKSDGHRGFASGENYTLEVTNDIAAAIEALKAQWGASKVILVGHSGGATIAANVAALHPGLVQHVFLVACPCDVPVFRRHMAELQRNPIWLLPVHSLSPQETLDRMEKGTEVTAISGENDPLALPVYARDYVAKAKERGVSASMITIPGKGHEVLDEAIVIEEIAKAVRGG